jgi:sugar transferase (PEP-CTERM/EpsH1 system associated)
MKVLVVDEEIPFPLNTGKRIRTYYLLKYLANKHEIIFLSRRHEETEIDHIADMEKINIKAIVVPHVIRKKSGVKFYLALIANLFSIYPYSVSSHQSNLLTQRTAQIIKDEQIDLIHCEWTPYAVNLKNILGRIPSVVDAHNVEAMIWKRNFEVESNILKKLYIFFQWKKMEKYEKFFFKRFTRCVSVSAQDKSIISRWTSSNNVSEVSNGVDVDYFKSLGGSPEPYSLVFTGSMDWRPNVDGILYFLDEIWPVVKIKFPRCQLTIVGRRPMDILVKRVDTESSVILTGTVDDVRPFMKKSMVYIVPLRVGGGSRLKILEALSMKMPVVSTTVGAEGLDLEHMKNIVLADTPGNFVDSIEMLFNNRELRESLGGAGRKIVEQQYRWEKLSEKLEETWNESLKYHRTSKFTN